MGMFVKRLSLANVDLDGWDDECFALVKPATYKDRKEWRELKDEGSLEWQHKLVRDHFVSGKGRDESSNLVELSLEDTDINVLNDVLALGIMGINIDPKALAALPQTPATNEKRKLTETSSSEDSPPTSMSKH